MDNNLFNFCQKGLKFIFPITKFYVGNKSLFTRGKGLESRLVQLGLYCFADIVSTNSKRKPNNQSLYCNIVCLECLDSRIKKILNFFTCGGPWVQMNEKTMIRDLQYHVLLVSN